jgi:hypothetical protein
VFVRLAVDLGPEDDFADEEPEGIYRNDAHHHAVLTALVEGDVNVTSSSSVLPNVPYSSQSSSLPVSLPVPPTQSSSPSHRMLKNEENGEGVSRSVSPLSSIGSVDLGEGKEGTYGGSGADHILTSSYHLY